MIIKAVWNVTIALENQSKLYTKHNTSAVKDRKEEWNDECYTKWINNLFQLPKVLWASLWTFEYTLYNPPHHHKYQNVTLSRICDAHSQPTFSCFINHFWQVTTKSSLVLFWRHIMRFSHHLRRSVYIFQWYQKCIS